MRNGRAGIRLPSSSGVSGCGRRQPEAAGRFARGDTIKEITHDLRITEGPVRLAERLGGFVGDL